MQNLLCKTCQKSKPSAEFYEDRRLKGGYKSSCKQCLNERATEWRKAHPDRARAANRRWRETHPEQVREANRRPRLRRYDAKKRREWHQHYLAENPEAAERIRTQARSRKQAINDFLRAYKLEHGCTDCGYREHHAGLDFDHVRGAKTVNMSLAKSLQQAQRELVKCEVRCRNCHAIRHFEENHSTAS